MKLRFLFNNLLKKGKNIFSSISALELCLTTVPQTINKKSAILLLSIVVLFPHIGKSQSLTAKIQVEKSSIDIKEPLVLKLEIQGAETKSISGFPEIPGFVKRKLNTVSSTSIEDGEEFSSTTYLQRYQALRTGKFIIPAFSLTVENTKVNFKATSVQVLAGTLPDNFDPNTDANSEEEEMDNEEPDAKLKNPRKNASESAEKQPQTLDEQTAKFVKKNQPFLQTKISKLSVYRGEAFQISLYFLVPKNYREEIQFYNLDAQLSEIINKIKPSGCWEENFPIDEVKEKSVKIGNKAYLEYKLFQSYYYPYKVENIKIPPISLEMSVLREGKEEGPFGVKIKEVYQKFSAPAFEIEVKNLPPHPLMNSVPVGDYRLKEEISNTRVNTGTGINYFFTLIGTGYFKTVTNPFKNSRNLDIFPTTVLEKITRTEANIKGSKEFRYQLVPLIAGEYSLKNNFEFIYFNTTTKLYDTLSSAIKLAISGDSIASSVNANGISTEEDFYKKNIPSASSKWISTEGNGFSNRRDIYNYILIGLAIFILMIILYKRN